MFGSTVLEIVIGMSFIYLVLSLVCSHIQEQIASRLNWRSDMLKTGLESLLNSQQGGIVDQIYKHPLIRGMMDPRDKAISYIPARSFAMALMDVIGGGPGADDADLMPKVRGSVAQLPDGAARDMLMTLVTNAGDDVVRLRQNIERWFDDGMNRVSGWYKRRAQNMIFVIALGVAVITNADSFAMIASLANAPTLRQSIVARAGQATPENATQATSIHELKAELEELYLPIGWSSNADDPRRFPWLVADGAAMLMAFGVKVLGLLFTTIAVSMGAPFWFDLLNKVSNFRFAGQKPPEAPQWPDVPPPLAGPSEKAGDKPG